MKMDYFPKFFTLLAGTVVCLIAIINDMDTTYSLELLLAVLVIFYLLSSLAKVLIQKVLEGNMFVQRNSSANFKLKQALSEMQNEMLEAERNTHENEGNEG